MIFKFCLKAFALTGRLGHCRLYPGRCAGLGGVALTGRLAKIK